ncbi:MAG: hypothetical protein LQ346_009032 [Caloplaca aetnensis]|nr:MAG: hypothetical protein LQ346_009032 [Caloplaca aetnensis]
MHLYKLRSPKHTFTMHQNPLMEDIYIWCSPPLLEAVSFDLAHTIILKLGRRFGFYQDHRRATAHAIMRKSEIQIFLDGFYTVFLVVHVPLKLSHRAIAYWQSNEAGSGWVIEDEPGLLLQSGIFGLAYGILVALARRWGSYQDTHAGRHAADPIWVD